MCSPSCDRRICGSDGCDGSCGDCKAAELCMDGRCVRPVCGDGMVEGDEECDGTDDCGDDCKRLSVAVSFCISGISVAEPVCQRCVCQHCTQAIMDCYLTGNATRDAACRLMSECGSMNGCAGLEDCVCGTGQCRPPNGPCLDVADAALKTLDLGVADIRPCLEDPECAFYRAEAYGQCVAKECPDECLKKSP